MNETLRLANLTAFYFGAHVAADPTSPEAIRTVSKRAYRDLNRTLHGIGTHPDKTTLLENTHLSLHQFVTGLETVATQDEFDKRYDTWCQNREHYFNEHPHPEREAFTLTYGQAQKWINMTLKYLAVLNHPAVADVYPYLHIPIDSIVYKETAHPTAGMVYPGHPEASPGHGSTETSTGTTNSASGTASPTPATVHSPRWTGRPRRG